MKGPKLATLDGAVMPSQFRRMNAELSDTALAMKYAMRLPPHLLCQQCGNNDDDTLIVETKTFSLPDHRRRIKGSVRWIGYKCACCKHVTKFNPDLKEPTNAE